MFLGSREKINNSFVQWILVFVKPVGDVVWHLSEDERELSFYIIEFEKTFPKTNK